MATQLSNFYLTLKKRHPSLSLSAIAKAITQEFDIEHVSYVDFRSTARCEEELSIYTTYETEWVSRYKEQRFHLIDPVLDATLGGVLPVDWSEVPKVDRASRKFISEAKEFGVLPNGISIPIHDHVNGRGVLALNSGLRDQEWRKYKKELVGDAIYLGCLIHTDLTSGLDEEGSQPPIRAREKEVLKWAAVGKTAWETAQIIRISERTVNHHLYSACAKLNVSNKTHAVAKAIRRRLINL